MRKLNLIKISILAFVLLNTISMITVSLNQTNVEKLNEKYPSDSSIHNVNTTHYASDVFISENYTYVANHYAGLAVIDISDPTNPGAAIQESTTGNWERL